MIKDVQHISKAHLDRINSQLAGDPLYAFGKGNNRALQDTNGREIFFTFATRYLVNVLTFGAFLALLVY